MISIHDNEVQSYTVDMRNKTIRLDTTWSHEDKREHTVVEFRGVTAHYLVDATYQNMLFSIEEDSIDTFIFDNKPLMQKSIHTCWPCFYGNLDELEQYLRKEEARYFVISASIGLNGWVLAREMEYIALEVA